MTQSSNNNKCPEIKIAATRVGKIALLTALSDEHEECYIKEQIANTDGVRLAVTFVSGKSSTVKDKFIQSLVGCALQNGIIKKKAGHIHAVIHAGLEALDGLSSTVPVNSSLKLKVAMTRDSEWVAVAIYGESAFYPMTNHERCCMGMMHI